MSFRVICAMLTARHTGTRPTTASDFPLFMLVVVLGFFADFSRKKVNLAQYFVIKTDPYAEYCAGLSASSCIQISTFYAEEHKVK